MNETFKGSIPDHNNLKISVSSISQSMMVSVAACGWSQDLKQVVLGDGEGNLEIWDFSTCAAINTLYGHREAIASCCLSPDGCFVVSCGDDHTYRLWTTSGAELVCKKARNKGATLCSWSPDGRYVIVDKGDFILQVLEASTGKKKALLNGYFNPIKANAFSPDSRCFISGGLDGNLKMWEIASGRTLTLFKAHNYIAGACSWSPDGRRILSGSNDGELILSDVITGKEIFMMQGHKDRIMSCSWSACGKYSVSSDHSGMLYVWNTDQGKLLEVFSVGSPIVSSVFSLDGNYLYVLDCRGRFHILLVEGLTPGNQVVTATRFNVCHQDNQKNISKGRLCFHGLGRFKTGVKTESSIAVMCNACRKRSTVNQSVLEAISLIHRECSIGPEDVPFMKLPSELWNIKELEADCTVCGSRLKFNPFMSF